MKQVLAKHRLGLELEWRMKFEELKNRGFIYAKVPYNYCYRRSYFEPIPDEPMGCWSISEMPSFP